MNKNTIILPKQLVGFFDDLSKINCYDYDTIDSTNKRAWELSNSGIKAPFVVTAKSQTAGRGQRGNQWQSTEGGLYLSLMLNLNLPIQKANQITLFSIWGVVNQLRELSIPVQIKWLNDLMLDNHKLGGILCETRSQKETIKQAVIGVGINYKNEVPESAISLKTWQQEYSITQVDSLLKIKQIVSLGILIGYHKYVTEGINSILNDYNYWLNSLNKQVLIKEKIQGKILGIKEKGNLKIQLVSVGAKSIISLSPQDYHISYHLINNEYYLISAK